MGIRGGHMTFVQESRARMWDVETLAWTWAHMNISQNVGGKSFSLDVGGKPLKASRQGVCGHSWECAYVLMHLHSWKF
eukprot:scaffold62383_cov19-Tisochrysis_lutea.AAC.2